jgi:hypothetical protein
LQSSCCGASYLFFLLSEGVGVPALWWVHRDSPAVTVRVWCLCTVGGRPPSTNRVVDCHSVEELDFQLLVRRDMTLLQGGAAWSTGLLCILEEQEWQVTAFFLSLGNVVFLLFDRGARALLLSGTVGSAEPPWSVGGVILAPAE